MDSNTFNKLRHYIVKTLGRSEWYTLKPKRFKFEVNKLIDYILRTSTARNKIPHIREYLRSLHRYCEFTEKTPKELIDEAEADEKLPRRKRVNPSANALAGFVDYLNSEFQLEHNSIVTSVAHVRTFYESNGFPVKGMAAPRPRRTRESVRMTRDLALEAYESAPTSKVRALVHFLWSTGMSISDACKLKKKDVEMVGDWGVISLHRQKSGKFHMVTVPPDCLDTLRKWHKAQNKDDDRLLGYETPALQQALRRLAERMGKWKKENGEKKNPLHAHNFRHGFNNALKGAGLDYGFVKFMMGHSTGVGAAYDELTPEQVVERVKPYYEALRLTGAVNRVGDLEQRIVKLEARINRLTKIIEGKPVPPVKRKKKKKAS